MERVTLPVGAFSVRTGADAVWVTSPADGGNDSLHKPEAWVAQEVDPTTNLVSEPIRCVEMYRECSL